MDREQVIKGLECCARTDGKYCGHCHYTNEGDCVAEMSKDVLAMLKEQPQIVRCKDCKYKQKSYVADRQWWCNRLEKHCDDEWFCADGEREYDG